MDNIGKKVEEMTAKVMEAKDRRKEFSRWNLANASSQTDYSQWEKNIDNFSKDNINIIIDAVDNIGVISHQ